MLVLCKNTQVHHDGYHQPGNKIHIVAAIWGSRATMIHLGQPKTPFAGESSRLRIFVFFRLTMGTVLLPTAVSLWIQTELFGFSLALGMTTAV